VALRHVANAFAETEQLAQALIILNDVSEISNRTPVLITAATKQALAGDAAAALATANNIDEVRFRAVVLGKIALTQAENGDLPAAEGTLEMALAAIKKIKCPTPGPMRSAGWPWQRPESENCPMPWSSRR